ncbi:hypothetical protein Tco_0755229 [Tanacetum coccineum]
MRGPKEEEANYAYGGYQGNYYGRSFRNWRDRQPRDDNQNSQPREDNPSNPPTPKRKFDVSDFEKTMQQFSGKTYDPPVNPNAKTTIIHDDNEDEADEAENEVESSSSKQAKSDPLPLKAYKLKIPYPQHLHKEKMEERYAKFINLIKEVRINVPLIDVLAGMPNYGKFLKDLMSNKSKMEQIVAAFLNEECSAIVQNKLLPKLGDPRSFLIPCTLVGSVEYPALADLGTSINLMAYSLYASLSENTLKPTRMSIRLANNTYQYPMELLRTCSSNKELNLGVGDDRITFLINKAMQHSHSNDDTCFCIDVIDEVTKEELDSLLDDFKTFSSTSKKINESSLDKEFKEFMVVDVEEIPEQEEEVEDNFEELPIEENLRIKTSIQEPPTDLEMKPLPKHLEYAFLEKDSLLPVVISALLKDYKKKRLVSILKKHMKHLLGKHLIFRALAHLTANTKSTLRTMQNPSFRDNVGLTQT